MERRSFISATGCVLFGSTAGCIKQETTPFGERIDEKVASFTVQDFTIQQSIAYRGSVHPRIRNGKNTQYLIFGVDVEQDVENRHIYDRFTMSTDGSINEELQVTRIPTENQGELQRDIYLIYEVSRKASIIDERLKFSGLSEDYEWSVRDAVESNGFTEYVENPPNPVVESFSVPDSMTTDRDLLKVRVTISENSDGNVSVNEPLKVLIGSTKISGSSVYTAPVMNGQTVTRQFSVPVYPNQGADTETISVNWGQGSISKEVSTDS